MRETPSGGVGSIQDQGVNYIQLNIQPPIPLLNTELRNATLNKDYERSTPLDRAQLAAQPGQPWPRGPRMGGAGAQAGCLGGGRVWEKSQPLDRSLAFRAPSLSSKVRTQCRSWGPPLCPLLVQPPSPHLPTRIQRNEGSSFRPQFPRRRRRRRWRQQEAGLVPHPRPSRLFLGGAARKRRGGAHSSQVPATDPHPAAPTNKGGQPCGQRG